MTSQPTGDARQRLVIERADEFQYDGIRVLLDRDGSHFPDGDQPRAGGRPGTPYRPEREVRLFFYFLTVLGRDEQVVGHQGIGATRDQLIALMLAERGVRRTGGAKRLNAYLSGGRPPLTNLAGSTRAGRPRRHAPGSCLVAECWRSGPSHRTHPIRE